jgi:hypothetical protein
VWHLSFVLAGSTNTAHGIVIATLLRMVALAKFKFEIFYIYSQPLGLKKG